MATTRTAVAMKTRPLTLTTTTSNVDSFDLPGCSFAKVDQGRLYKPRRGNVVRYETRKRLDQRAGQGRNLGINSS